MVNKCLGHANSEQLLGSRQKVFVDSCFRLYRKNYVTI